MEVINPSHSLFSPGRIGGSFEILFSIPQATLFQRKEFPPERRYDSFSSPNLIFDFNKGGGETERGRASFEGSVLASWILDVMIQKAEREKGKEILGAAESRSHDG